MSDQGWLYACLSQQRMGEHLDQRLGEYTWSVDMTVKRLSFVSSGGEARIDTTLDLIASLAPGPRSLLWGWAHPQTTGELCGQLRAYGEAHGIPSLCSPEVPLPTSATGPELSAEIDSAAHVIGAVAVAVTGQAPYYSVPAAGGTRVVFLLSGYDFPALRLDYRVPARVMEALSLGMTHDHRAAVHWLGVRAGWEIGWNPEWTQATLHDPVTGSGLTTTFDTSARLVHLEAHLVPGASSG
ncbi:MAG: DUF6882 domain-containing protein [Dermatophilaceae bacterium]